jgi:hypothetical protein
MSELDGHRDPDGSDALYIDKYERNERLLAQCQRDLAVLRRSDELNRRKRLLLTDRVDALEANLVKLAERQLALVEIAEQYLKRQSAG